MADKAGVMIIVSDGLILCVSRKDDHTKFGLPGGKIEKGESALSAAIRETFEETCFVVESGSSRLYSNDGIVCFFARNWNGPVILSSHKEEGVVAWKPKEVLTHAMAAFPDYNAAALEKFAMMFPHIILK